MQQKRTDSRDITMLGIRIINDRENGEWDEFTGGEILYIDLWSPKSHHRVPRFHTTKGIFTVILTLAQCKKIFHHLTQLDSGILIDMDQIDKCTKSKYKELKAHFRGNPVEPAVLAWSKRSLVEHLLEKDHSSD